VDQHHHPKQVTDANRTRLTLTGVELGNQHVVLIGMMGAGKTTVGRLLAKRLGWGFWDNDEALQNETGHTAAEFQRERGQPALHQVEDRLLREVLGRPEPTVVAAAGSVAVNPGALKGPLSVWLKTSAQTERQHITASGQRHRPLPADALATLERLGAERASEYARLANVTVEVADAPATTCQRVITALRAIQRPADAQR
jgi:shikimate kinase